MHQSLVKFSESEASNHTPSLADFTTTMVGFKVFGTHKHPSALRSHQFRGFRHSLYRRNIQSAENCSQLKADKSQSNPAHGNGQWYAGRDRNNKPDHLTVHGNRSGSTSLTVVGLPDEEFQGHANSCRSGSGPFGACALPDVFELGWPSVFTSVLTFTEVFDMGKAPQ